MRSVSPPEAPLRDASHRGGPARLATARRRAPPYLLWTAAGLAYAFLYVPLLIVVVYSFNDSRLNAEWVGFTLDWYRKLAADNELKARVYRKYIAPKLVETKALEV